MKIRYFEIEKDYPIVESWWKARKWLPCTKEMLSNAGFIIDNIAAIWIYPTANSKLCWIGFPISNPESSKEERNEALDILFDTSLKMAKEMNYEYIMTTSNIPAVIERFEKHGFNRGDENIMQLWRRI